MTARGNKVKDIEKQCQSGAPQTSLQKEKQDRKLFKTSGRHSHTQLLLPPVWVSLTCHWSMGIGKINDCCCIYVLWKCFAPWNSACVQTTQNKENNSYHTICYLYYWFHETGETHPTTTCQTDSEGTEDPLGPLQFFSSKHLHRFLELCQNPTVGSWKQAHLCEHVHACMHV